MLRKSLLVWAIILVSTLAYAVPAMAANGSLGLEMTFTEETFPTLYARFDTSPNTQFELAVGGLLDGDFLRAELNYLLVLLPGERFSPVFAIGLGANRILGNISPDLHLAVGATFMINDYLQLSSDVTVGYDGDIFTTIGIGVGIRFFD